MIFKRRDLRPCARMAVTNLYREFDIFAGQIAPDPICPVDLEFVTDQIVNLANDYAICLGVEIDDVGLTQTKEKIRLVFAWIGPFAQNSAVFLMFDDRVMTRGDVIAAERFGFAPEVTEL